MSRHVAYAYAACVIVLVANTAGVVAAILSNNLTAGVCGVLGQVVAVVLVALTRAKERRR